MSPGPQPTWRKSEAAVAGTAGMDRESQQLTKSFIPIYHPSPSDPDLLNTVKVQNGSAL